MGDGTTTILNQLLTKKQPADVLIVFTGVVFFG